MKLKNLILFFILLSLNNIFCQSNEKLLNDIAEINWVYPDTPDSLMYSVPFSFQCKMIDSTQIFGKISGIAHDKDDNLYVWDSAFNTLWKFSTTGEIIYRKNLEKIGNIKLRSVGGAFAVSRNGVICLGDKSSKSLIIFDQDVNFINKFDVEMLPATIAFGLDGSIYLAGFEFTYKGNLIHHYSLKGEFLGSFCEREEKEKATLMSGHSGKLVVDIEGNIIYSHFYPYKVEIFSNDGTLLKAIKKVEDRFIKPKIEIIDKRPTVTASSGLRGLLTLPSGDIAVIVVYNFETNDWGIDLYDSNLKLKKNIPNSVLPKNYLYRFGCIDSKGKLFLEFVNLNDDPTVVKLSLK